MPVDQKIASVKNMKNVNKSMTWSTKKLGEISKIRMGETLIKKDLTGEGVPVYSADSLEKPWGFTSKNKLEFSRGAIIVGARGTLGSVKLPDDTLFTSTQTTIILSPQQKTVNSTFLFYYLRKVDFKKLRGGSGIPMLTVARLNDLEIPLPPLSEQRKIVYVLDSVQDAIRAQEKIIEKTKELKKSMMTDLFKYGGPSFRKGRKLKKTEIGEIPENWEVVTIKNIGEVVTGTTPSTLVKDYWNGDIPFVTPTDITKKYVENTERYISQKGLQKARLLPKDSVLVTCIASIGKISIAQNPCISNQQINAIICKEDIDNEYIYYVMNHMSDKLKMWAGQTTSPIVKKSLFEKFILPLPKNKNEQREIAEILQTIDQKIEIEQKKKTLYEELFKTMLNKLMTGEIKVDNLKL